MNRITVLTGPERRRRWPEEERRQIVTAAFAPGASVAAVARQYDIATSLIYRWRQQVLEPRGEGPSFTPALVVEEPACLPSNGAAEDRASISVALPDGTRVKIGAMAPAGLVAAALRALR